jgi:Zn-dependent protease
VAWLSETGCVFLLQSFTSGLFIFQLLSFLVAIVFHELAHGYVAYKLGDPTAKNQGRLTLNPVSHIDPLGLLLILFGPFGWAKPVPVNPYRFKNPRLGMVLVAAAGPIANLFIAIVAVLLFKLFLPYFYNVDGTPIARFFNYLLQFMIQMNVMLFIFNLIPIPPLDGSKIVFGFVPGRYAKQLYMIERYGPFFLLLVLITPLNRFLAPVLTGGIDMIYSIVGLSLKG